MYGFRGKLLQVDLENGKIWEEVVPNETAREFLGGRGLGAKILYDKLKSGVDPLGRENLLVFMTGPLQGSMIPGSTHYVVMCKSPQSNGIGEAHAAGSIGPEIKYAGYDGVVFSGVAEEPVYLWLHDGATELRDAKHLWGKTTHETETLIKKELKVPSAAVASIGLAGENLVKFAGILNDFSRVAGRTGVGAVMGSKKLKAVAVFGREKRIPLADRERVLKLSKELSEKLLRDQRVIDMQKYGTPFGVTTLNVQGILPTKNYQTGFFEGADKISGGTITETIQKGVFGCVGCPVRCWRVAEVKDGKYKGDFNDGPEYETVASLGSLCLNDNLEAIAYANHLCNLYSLDTISTGNVIAFAIECYDKGLINKGDTGGVKLDWNDPDCIIKMIEKIARREDIGNILAEGVKKAAEKIGGNSKSFALEVKGVEVAMHEPRGKKAVGLMYATASRGATHMDSAHDTAFEKPDVLPELGLVKALDRKDIAGKPELTVKTQDVYAIINSAILCMFTGSITMRPVKLFDYTNWFEAVTGNKYSVSELMITGERINNLTRAFNVREGMSRKDDYLPPRFSENMSGGNSSEQKITRADLDKMLDEYYQLRGWDVNTGIPTASKLASLGLSRIAIDIKAP
ncbi:MAG: aldehyde ferredoxin oxidoreductase family protein [Nitrososphaeria archaeon]|jgi:aldehyde:ferredoxin oxidoreductase